MNMDNTEKTNIRHSTKRKHTGICIYHCCCSFTFCAIKKSLAFIWTNGKPFEGRGSIVCLTSAVSLNANVLFQNMNAHTKEKAGNVKSELMLSHKGKHVFKWFLTTI